MDGILKDLYYNPKNPSAFTGVEKVYLAAKEQLPHLTRREVREWLAKQYTYTMHKPITRKFARRQYIVSGIDDQWQIDLADMTQLRRFNDGCQYLLTCIDIYSKFAWVVPVKNKSSQEIARALDGIFKEGRKPSKIQSDKGREFLNHLVQQLLKHHGIDFFTSEDPQIKCAVVERFNRTIKGRIWKYFTKSRLFRYVDVLPDLVSGYNNSIHRSIGNTPASTTENILPLRYGKKSKEPDLKVGDRVRISRAKGIFEKGYLPNWTEEIFTISQVLKTNPPVFKLKDYYGEEIRGSFYSQELQKTDVDEYWIEKVIKKRGDMALVKWTGYKNPEWIPISSINEPLQDARLFPNSTQQH